METIKSYFYYNIIFLKQNDNFLNSHLKFLEKKLIRRRAIQVNHSVYAIFSMYKVII